MIKTKVLSAVFIASAAFGLARTAAAADAPACEVDDTIKFGGMNWESNLILADVERHILEKGYGCKTEVVPTETLTALAALERGDLQVNTEIWLNSVSDAWAKAEKSGKVKRVGELYTGREAWYIPKYTASKFPDLKSAADLIRHKDAFADPESPIKAGFTAARQAGTANWSPPIWPRSQAGQGLRGLCSRYRRSQKAA